MGKLIRYPVTVLLIFIISFLPILNYEESELYSSNNRIQDSLTKSPEGNTDGLYSFGPNSTIHFGKIAKDDFGILVSGHHQSPMGWDSIPSNSVEGNNGAFIARQTELGQFSAVWVIQQNMSFTELPPLINSQWDMEIIQIRATVSVNIDSVIVVGCFNGSWSINGQEFQSEGSADGFIARISLNSSDNWVHTFGTNRTFNMNNQIGPECVVDLDKTERGTYIIAGATEDTFILNHSIPRRGELTSFIMEITAEGGIVWSASVPVGMNDSIIRGMDWTSRFNQVVISTEIMGGGSAEKSSVLTYSINGSAWLWQHFVPGVVSGVEYTDSGNSVLVTGIGGKGTIPFLDGWNYSSSIDHTWVMKSSSYSWAIEWVTVINGSSIAKNIQLEVSGEEVTLLTNSPNNPPIPQLSPKVWGYEGMMLTRIGSHGDIEWVHGLEGMWDGDIVVMPNDGVFVSGTTKNLSIEASDIIMNGSIFPPGSNNVPDSIFIWHMSDVDNDGVAATRDNCVTVSNWTSNPTSDYDMDGCRDFDEDDDDDDDSQLDILDRCSLGQMDWSSNNSTDYDDDGCKDNSEDDDDDNDLVIDEFDRCQFGELGWLSNQTTDFDSDGCRDSTEDSDDDSDGVDDTSDNCPLWPNTNQTDYDGDELGDSCDDDDDSDGVIDELDSCPFGWLGWLSNSADDRDGDGCSDSVEDEDDDNDGVPDLDDKCFRGEQGWLSTTSTDHDNDGCQDNSEDSDDDGDGIIDVLDSCPLGLINWESGNVSDFDSDGCADLSEDMDDDADSIPDLLDNCPFSNFSLSIRTDRDSDGCLDEYEDDDDDNDGMPDFLDWCQNGELNWHSNGTTDLDSDGCRDSTEDSDDDNDGIEDNVDVCPNSWVAFVDDSNHDGCSDNSTDDEQNPIIANQENNSGEGNSGEEKFTTSVEDKTFSWIDVIWLFMFGIPVWMMISYRRPTEEPSPPEGYQESE